MDQCKAAQNSNRSEFYFYQDWSNVPPNSSDVQAIKRELDLHPDAWKLPVKLNKILANPDYSNAIEWLPHGRSWRIKDKKKLLNKVLPRYFQIANFNSFIRLVNAWGFRRIKFGHDSDSYYHEQFLRGMPHLHIRMKRLLSKDKKAPLVSKDNNPNFCKMPPLHDDQESAKSLWSWHSFAATHQSISDHIEPSYFSTHRKFNDPAASPSFHTAVPDIRGNAPTRPHQFQSILKHDTASIEGQHKVMTRQQNLNTLIAHEEGHFAPKSVFPQSRLTSKNFRNFCSHQQMLTQQNHMAKELLDPQVSMLTRQQQFDRENPQFAISNDQAVLTQANSPGMNHNTQLSIPSSTSNTLSFLRSRLDLPNHVITGAGSGRGGFGVRQRSQTNFPFVARTRECDFVLSPRYIFYRVPQRETKF
eukprot:CAMPEP_0171337370 /NCGR_PEP_ID=MMETSP0878-20121228/6651_1 /TAXON_ID=67004 /ORGANISM="Thalassiosira weissflogii, Strain CCMP1336" /LENGTH=415 /DNA_ID=CAMNT_0011838989 /DNA_START=36 /DNA_END=1283 /DNA_ORIENTATION=-